MTSFIIASCKPWHKIAFDDVSSAEPGKWVYASTRDELDSYLVGESPRYIFFLHWNWLVPEKIWRNYECVCFHMTNVPYGRGGSPLQNLILAGHRETRVTALRMIGEMDAGPVYTSRHMSLEGRAEEIYLRAGALSWEMIHWIIANRPEPLPQRGDAIYFSRRSPEQSCLPVKGELEEVYDFIRMLDAPTYPLAFAKHGAFRLELSNAELGCNEIKAHVVIRLDMDNQTDE